MGEYKDLHGEYRASGVYKKLNRSEYKALQWWIQCFTGVNTKLFRVNIKQILAAGVQSLYCAVWRYIISIKVDTFS